MNTEYADLKSFVDRRNKLGWLSDLIDESDRILLTGNHGDLPRWRGALERLPGCSPFVDASIPEFGKPVPETGGLKDLLLEFHPWRKGPLRIGGLAIQTEWRSDWKWDRISPHVNLEGQDILDVGCGNGYYGWRMLAQGARSVIGVDPTLVYAMQWLACRHFTGPQPNWVLPLGVEHLPEGAGGFGTVFSMGVLYHRKDPVRHLRRLGSLLSPGGCVVLETLVLEGGEDRCLVPEDRYARMRNVWAVPGLPRLASWIRQAGFGDAQLLDVSRTSTEEQRSTAWMRFESLRECLDPDNDRLTIEGYPAPVRAALLLRGP